MNNLLPKLIVTLLLFCTCANVFSAADKHQRRFSISISGGASLGAYEAGLNWGLLKILRNVDKLDSSVIGKNYEFEAASFSGASAGAINTLLSSLTWCNLPESEGGFTDTIDDNIFRDTWLTLDINTLLPPRADSKYYNATDSLLARYRMLRAAGDLRELWKKPHFRAGCRIPLGITVTHIEPEILDIDGVKVKNQLSFIPFEARTQKDNTFGFYFDPNDYLELLDASLILLPNAKDAPKYSIEDQRIQDALMASSAFPGAFGHVRMKYCRLNVTNASGRAIPAKDDKSGNDLVCPIGYVLTEDNFADGGLFNNLPIGMARILAEKNVHDDGAWPVEYVYLDPGTKRYKTPRPVDKRACAGANPPDACRTMVFDIPHELSVLMNAAGTAREVALYDELSSLSWTLSLVKLSRELADKVQLSTPDLKCKKDIPFMADNLSCAESIAHAGLLLKMAYKREFIPIRAPYSALKLSKMGLTKSCDFSHKSLATSSRVKCKLDIERYRDQLATMLLDIAQRDEHFSKTFKRRIRLAKLSIHNDRELFVTDRGVPITGSLLSEFGAFLDYKFREYDFYVGVYDAISNAVDNVCGLNFAETYQKQAYQRCEKDFFNKFYHVLGVDKNPRSKYLFARMAQWEAGKQDVLSFAYTPMPEEDRDMRIIFEALQKTLQAGEESDSDKKGFFFVEQTFFNSLNDEGFTASATEDGSAPLLAGITRDTSHWGTELSRRLSTRLVYLGEQADDVYTAREPDPELRNSSYTTLTGIGAYSLLTATYKYPDYAFSPSVAADGWVWRNVIPYEVAFNIANNGVILTWQPTWYVADKNLLAVRFGLGIGHGINSDRNTNGYGDYGSIGFDYTRQTGSGSVSGWGITPTVYHQWSETTGIDQNTFGGDVHVAVLKDKLRLSLGVKDINNSSDSWFLTIGITDMPGLIYWLTR